MSKKRKKFSNLTAALYIWALPDGRPVRVETCKSWLNIAILIKLRVFVGSNCNNLVVMHGIENVKKENAPIFPIIIYLLVV